jgi:cyanophycinase
VPRKLIALFVVFVALAARSEAEPPKGTVLAIGGGTLHERVVDRLVELSRNGRLVVCPAASERTEGPEVELFRKHGAKEVEVVDFRNRAEADDVARVASLSSAAGIFFTGGDQARLLANLRGSHALDAIRAAFAKGAVIAGTSAGCAVLGELAIEGDGDGEPLRGGKAPPVSEGFRLVPGTILDQHFLARRRHARLVAALLAHTDVLGIGVDEGSALEVRADEMEALGEGFVSIYQPLAGERTFRLKLLAPGERTKLDRR